MCRTDSPRRPALGLGSKPYASIALERIDNSAAPNVGHQAGTSKQSAACERSLNGLGLEPHLKTIPIKSSMKPLTFFSPILYILSKQAKGRI
jgi:hypothetical protein